MDRELLPRADWRGVSLDVTAGDRALFSAGSCFDRCRKNRGGRTRHECFASGKQWRRVAGPHRTRKEREVAAATKRHKARFLQRTAAAIAAARTYRNPRKCEGPQTQNAANHRVERRRRQQTSRCGKIGAHSRTARNRARTSASFPIAEAGGSFA